MAAEKNARVRRIYDDPEKSDGTRVLVDRVWPRGVSKDKAELDDWAKAVAPSTELRKWYSHDPEKFEEFSRRYREELKAEEPAEALESLRGYAKKGRLTLLTAAKRDDISHATVLATIINGRRGGNHLGDGRNPSPQEGHQHGRDHPGHA